MTKYATDRPDPRRQRGAPIAGLVAGAVTAVLALGLLVGGGVTFWASHAKTDGDGYYSTSAHGLSSSTSALVTEDLDVSADAPDWLFGSDQFGRLRISAKSTVAGKDAFVGIGPKRAVDAYLAEIGHDEITDVAFDPFEVDTQRVGGGRRLPAAPESQSFWAASGSSVDWAVREGDWSIVIMNADGSRGVSVDAEAGVKVPLIREIGVALMILGGLGIVGAGVLTGVSARAAARPQRAAV